MNYEEGGEQSGALCCVTGVSAGEEATAASVLPQPLTPASVGRGREKSIMEEFTVQTTAGQRFNCLTLSCEAHTQESSARESTPADFIWTEPRRSCVCKGGEEEEED